MKHQPFQELQSKYGPAKKVHFAQDTVSSTKRLEATLAPTLKKSKSPPKSFTQAPARSRSPPVWPVENSSFEKQVDKTIKVANKMKKSFEVQPVLYPNPQTPKLGNTRPSEYFSPNRSKAYSSTPQTYSQLSISQSRSPRMASPKSQQIMPTSPSVISKPSPNRSYNSNKGISPRGILPSPSNLRGSNQTPVNGRSSKLSDIPSPSRNSAKILNKRPSGQFVDNSPMTPLTQMQTTFSSMFNAARLQDLCMEDREKIGELMKRLAQEKEDKEKFRYELEEKERHYMRMIEELNKANENISKDAGAIKKQFERSLDLLKDYQDYTKTHLSDSSKTYSEILTKSEMKRRSGGFSEDLENPREGTPDYDYANYRKELSQSKEENWSNTKNRDLIRVEPGKTEKTLIEYKLGHKIKNEGRAISPLEVIQKEEKTLGELRKIKEEIKELSTSFRSMGLSPQRSPEFTHPAAKGIPPITLIHEYKTQNESVPVTQFDTDYRPQMTSNTKSSKSSKSKKSDRSNRTKKESGAKPDSKSNSKRLNKTTANASTSSKAQKSTSMHQELSGRTEEDMAISSDDDEQEIEVAQKWLDHRKKKLEMLSKEFQSTRRGENQFESGKYATKETLDTLESEHYHAERQIEQEQIPIPLPRKVEKRQPEIISGSQKTSQRPTPQLPGESRPDSRTAESNPFYNNALYSTLKTKSGESEGNLTYTRNSQTTSKSSLSGIDLNRMTREEMIELKKVLEERIQLESLDDKIKIIHMSAQNKLQRIEELLANSASENTQTPSSQARQNPPPRKNSNSSAKGSKQEKNIQLGVDYSLMNDFDSIRVGLNSSEYSTPQAAGNHHIVIMKEPKTTPLSSHKESEERVDELDLLYQQKLKEFLRIRDKVLQNKKNRGQQPPQIQTEDLFKKKSDVTKSTDFRYAAFKSYDLTPNDDTIPEETLSENELVLSVTQSRIGQDLTEIKSQPSVQKTPVHNNLLSEKKEESKKKVQIVEKPAARPPRQFYDAGLLDLVQDIEKKDVDKKEKKKEYILPERNPTLKIDDESRIRSSLEEEFNSLFNSVRTMKTSSIEETERLNEQLLNKFEKNDLMQTSYSSEELSEKDDKEVNDISASMSRQISSRRNESSLVETDSSVLMITKKIKEMKAQSRMKKF